MCRLKPFGSSKYNIQNTSEPRRREEYPEANSDPIFLSFPSIAFHVELFIEKVGDGDGLVVSNGCCLLRKEESESGKEIRMPSAISLNSMYRGSLEFQSTSVLLLHYLCYHHHTCNLQPKRKIKMAGKFTLFQ
jgi:hypothetical protein